MALECIMGIGNYYLEDAESVYIDKEDVYGEDYWLSEYLEFAFEFDDLISHVLHTLPASFQRSCKTWLDNERLLIAESEMFRVCIVDWESYFSLNIEPKDDTPCAGLARYHLNKTAKRIFDKLNKIYHLRIRCSAWTSGSRTFEHPLAKSA